MASASLSTSMITRAIRPVRQASRPLKFSLISHSKAFNRQFTQTTIMSQTNGLSPGEDVPETEKWKYRAPYRVHEKNEDFDTKYEGQCHCGKVTFQLSREEPLDSKFCHCTTCQHQHAAPFQWAAIFHKDDINFTNGHHDLEWYDPSTKSNEHKLPCKVRCQHCHAPISKPFCSLSQ